MTTALRIKVCGMRDRENIAQIAALSPDMMGFIFYAKSPRFVGECPDEKIFALPRPIEKVAVFVNEDADKISGICERYGFGTVQLHGDESPEFCDRIRKRGLKVIKALGVQTADDIARIEAYIGHADMVLLDTKTPERGGSGEKFDWNILSLAPAGIPIIVSGGISPSDVQSLRKLSGKNLRAVDINSRFETSPALKDTSKVAEFIKEIRR